MLDSAEADYAATQVWFGGLTPPSLPFYVYADPNAGGAYHMTCAGTGSPTVVLVSGTGEMSASWARVVPQVTPRTRVCAYDRAGQGWSDDAPHPQRNDSDNASRVPAAGGHRLRGRARTGHAA